MSDSDADPQRAIDRAETIVRYVDGAHVDPGTGRINGSAFQRRETDVDGVSVTRRGILAIPRDEDRQAIRTVTASRMKMGRTAVFAELTVGALLDRLAEFRQPIFVCADALAAEADMLANPAHALVVGFPFKEQAIGSLTSEVAGDRMRLAIHDWFAAVQSQIEPPLP